MKSFLIILYLIVNSSVLACPGCVGSMDDPKMGNIVPILAGFIVLTYIPFYLIYKTIIKNKNFNDHIDEGLDNPDQCEKEIVDAGTKESL